MDDDAIITYACQAMPFLQEMPGSPYWRGRYPYYLGREITYALYGGDEPKTMGLLAEALRAQHRALFVRLQRMLEE